MRVTSMRRWWCLLLWLPYGLATAAGDHHHHHHEAIALTDAALAPSVAIRVEADAMAGWNLQILTTRFAFAPERVNQVHVPGEGHAHVYVDGKKYARLYGPWVHLESLGSGSHEIRVTLNANDHREFTLDGVKIEAMTTVVEE